MGAVIARLVGGINFHQLPNPGGEDEIATVVTGLLREVDPSIDPNHLAHLPTEAIRTEAM
jgi:hypothetical protein